MATTAPAHICANPVCKVSEDGRCVEGVPLERCSYYGRIVEDTEDRSSEEDEAVDGAQSGLPLHLAGTLDTVGAGEVLRRSATRVVAIVAPNDAGKTSLIAGLYDLFQEGPVGEVGFAGSDTLVGFEQVCHHARVHSRRRTPYMPRTVFGSDVTFFHLDVLRRSDEVSLALLIADRAGEDYLSVTEETSNAGKLFELRRADTITLLVNGERLVDDAERQETRASAQAILQGLDEGGALVRDRKLALVLTKQDAVLKSPHAERARRDFADMLARIRGRFGNRFSAVEGFEVAASPRGHSPLARGAGIDRLLAYWLQESPAKRLDPQRNTTGRMFDLLLPSDEVSK